MSNVNVKVIVHAKKNYSWNLGTCVCENSQYLKSISDTLVTQCDDMISVIDLYQQKCQIL